MTKARWLIAAALTAPPIALAQSAADYPVKPVRVIVPTAPGAATDLQARLLAQKLSETLQRPFVVDNRTGAGAIAGYEAVSKAAPDGYTLMASSVALTFVPALHPELRLNPARDFAAISLVAGAPFLLLVHPALPAHSVRELIALAKARPGALNMGVANAATTHLVSAMFATMAGIKLALVSYRGSGPVMIDTISGQLDMLFANVLAAQPYVKAGRLRALGVSTARRAAVLPELPTIAESGVRGFDVSTWHGWLAPAGTPAAIVNKLSLELDAAVHSPAIAKKLAEDGGVPAGGTPAQFQQTLDAEVARWIKVVKDAGLRVD